MFQTCSKLESNGSLTIINKRKIPAYHPNYQVIDNLKKKPELRLALIDRSLERGYRPGIVSIDAGYGNNTTFLLELEKRKLRYIGGIAKNRKVIIAAEGGTIEEIRLDNLAKSLPSQAFTPFQLNARKPKICVGGIY